MTVNLFILAVLFTDQFTWLLMSSTTCRSTILFLGVHVHSISALTAMHDAGNIMMMCMALLMMRFEVLMIITLYFAVVVKMMRWIKVN